MNFLVGVLLMYLPKEEDAYSALMLLMQQRQLRELYKNDLAALQVLPVCDDTVACHMLKQLANSFQRAV